LHDARSSCSDRVLTHCSLSLPLILSVDASDYGCGCVLAHVMPDGFERPIAFVSRTFSDPEKKYSVFVKELYALVWGVKRLRNYIADRECTVYTDHRPLLGLLQNKIPVIVNSRILRSLLFLGCYKLAITFRPGHKNHNSDALSRLPHDSSDLLPDPGGIYFISPPTDPSFRLPEKQSDLPLNATHCIPVVPNRQGNCQCYLLS